MLWAEHASIPDAQRPNFELGSGASLVYRIVDETSWPDPAAPAFAYDPAYLPFSGRIASSKQKARELEAGGKPSTWFPPGGLVEHQKI